MTSVTFIDHAGTARMIEARNGDSLMKSATDNGVPGIEGDCGGACACATCHVYVDPDWLPKISEQSAMEKDMIDFAVDTRDNSRLACQIEISDMLDGLVVRTPASQF